MSHWTVSYADRTGGGYWENIQAETPEQAIRTKLPRGYSLRMSEKPGGLCLAFSDNDVIKFRAWHSDEEE